MRQNWLPDWRDETHYPDDSAPRKRWAWEFLRRSDAYQNSFDSYAEACQFSDLDYSPRVIPPGVDSKHPYGATFQPRAWMIDLDSFSESEVKNRFGNDLIRFSLATAFINPCVDWEPEFFMLMLNFHIPNPIQGVSGQLPGIRVFDHDSLRYMGLLERCALHHQTCDRSRIECFTKREFVTNSSGRHIFPENAWEVVVKFDLRLNLDKQIDHLRSSLSREFEERASEIEVYPTALKMCDLRISLRALDAIASGAESDEVKDVLFSDKEDSYPDRAATGALKRALERADRYVSTGYLSLSLSEPSVKAKARKMQRSRK